MKSQTGICRYSYIPMRKDPSEKSEMVSQLLFGEVFTVDGEDRNWYHIIAEFDDYKGWIDKKMFSETTSGYFLKLKQNNYQVSDIPILTLTTPDNCLLLVPAGSTLENIIDKKIIESDTIRYQIIDSYTKKYIEKPRSVAQTAMRFIHTPYLWGGRSSFGFDCSGFTQTIYKIHGIRLPRDAWQQASSGQIINDVSEISPGDLVFFDDAGNNIIHVGIALSDNKIIHCSGMVRIDQLDQKGIFNSGINSYTHHLHSIRRITN